MTSLWPTAVSEGSEEAHPPPSAYGPFAYCFGCNAPMAPHTSASPPQECPACGWSPSIWSPLTAGAVEHMPDSFGPEDPSHGRRPDGEGLFMEWSFRVYRRF